MLLLFIFVELSLQSPMLLGFLNVYLNYFNGLQCDCSFSSRSKVTDDGAAY